MAQIKIKINPRFNLFLEFSGIKPQTLAKKLGYKEQQVYSILCGSVEPSLQFLKAVSKETKFPIENIIQTEGLRGKAKKI